MDLKQELINRLGVPENWDKYDYQTQRYSFDDMQEVLEDIVKKLTIPVVVGRSEQLFCPDCKCKARMQNGFIWCENDDCGGIYKAK